MQIEFISSFAVIPSDPAAGRKLFVEALGLPLEGADADADYLHSEEIDGAKHFGVWPLDQAAQACFGASEWPAELPTPQASVEFEVADAPAVADAAAELEERGYELVHHAREEPWGQTVARLLTADGVIVGISYAPWMHD